MEQKSSWDGDVFDRKPLADYLTRSLCAQSKRKSSLGKGLTVSLDAKWGAGKTFFVTRWVADLMLLGHPVVYFDAWENDIGEEASVALMASVVETMKTWQKDKLPGKTKLLRQATGLLQKSQRNLRRALVPAGKVLLSGALQKTIGVGLEELGDAVSGADSEAAFGRTAKAAGDILDKLFEESLLGHKKRKEELEAFRASVHDHLVLVKGHAEAKSKLPMFIFIDELDRCRPSYAVKLLEEVKHIFGVRDVVYVVSTNLSQLQNSIRSLYGAEFDGAGYLRRLFDREYVLPLPDHERFAATLFDPDGPITNGSAYSGLPRLPRYKAGIEKSWSIIATAFGLDLRSQHQLVNLVEEVASSLADRRSIHVLWLFFLCCLFQNHKDIFEACHAHSMDKQAFQDACRRIFIIDPAIAAAERSERLNQPERVVVLSYVLSMYYEFSTYTDEKAYTRLNQIDRIDYPTSVLEKLVEPFGHSWNPSNPRAVEIADYASLVRSAGFVTQS